MPYRVLVPPAIVETEAAFLRERGYEIVAASGEDAAALCRDVADCDALLVRDAVVSRQILEAGQKLKVVAGCGRAVDNIDVRAATELGIQVVGAPAAADNAMAEHAISLLLACAKHIPINDRLLREGRMGAIRPGAPRDVSGKVLGVVGLGGVGRRVAKKAAEGLDMNVIAHDPAIPPDDFPEGVGCEPDLRRLFAGADFVSLHLSSDADGRGLVTKALLSVMKKTAYLVNCAGGALVNEADLHTALSEGWIAGAGGELFVRDPPSADNPLLQLDNLVAGTHRAMLTAEALELMVLHAARGVDEVLRGDLPTWPANKIID